MLVCLTPPSPSVLLTVYDKNKVHLIKEILSEDIARHPENDKGSLFRDNTITTALMVAILKAPPCGTYWDNVFSGIVADMNMRVKVSTQLKSAVVTFRFCGYDYRK